MVFGLHHLPLSLLMPSRLGLATYPAIDQHFGDTFVRFDQIVVGIFIFEIAMKLIAYGLGFFRRGWNVFDLVIVGIVLVPGAAGFAVLRALCACFACSSPCLSRSNDATYRGGPVSGHSWHGRDSRGAGLDGLCRCCHVEQHCMGGTCRSCLGLCK